MSSTLRPVSSVARSPAQTATCSIARSRMPSRVAGSGASSTAWSSSRRKVGHQARVSFLERDRQYTVDLLERCRLPVLEEAKERLDRRQANIARHGRFFALVLKMLEEGADEPSIDLPSVSADGLTLSRSAANTNSSWKLEA
jgi:hypothetical protein